jgi:hypothetical protein
MTQALCLNCGEIKFGALCPCPQCQAGSTGNVDLDIAFSDFCIREDILRELGEFLQVIRFRSNDDELVFWTFLHYISQRHPHILKMTLPDDMAGAVMDLYECLPVPNIIIG